MKKIKFYTIPFIISMFFVLHSCNDTYEFHEEFIKDGEIIYTNKVDSLSTLPGNGRLKIAGYISNAFNVNEIIVYWNKGQNSQSFSYQKSANDTDPLSLIVENLEEKSYEFEVYSQDADGNRSIKVTTFGTVYGENYRANLDARAFNTFSYGSDSSVAINLKPSSDLTRATEVKYTDLSGAEVVATVLSDESDTVLDQVDINQPIMYRTYYVPTAKNEDGEETSIDEFDSDWKTYALPTTLKPILESVSIEPVLGGVIATWENPDNLEMDFNFQNMVGGNPVNVDLVSSESTGSHTIAAMESGEQDIEIRITDVYGNSWAMKYTVTPTPAVKLDNSNWSIIDFSSEEPAEANWSSYDYQGKAVAVIDGILETFWHSDWANQNPDYPHHFTIDLGSEKTIASFEMFRRRGNWWGANAHEFWVSSDNVNWTKVATFNDWLRTDDGIVVSVPGSTSGRYVKYVATDGYYNYAYMAELNIHGLE